MNAAGARSASATRCRSIDFPLPLFPVFERLQHLVKQQLATHFPEATFLAPHSWPNPDPGHLQVKLPYSCNSGRWPRKFYELRLRQSPDFVAAAAVPAQARAHVAHVGCWAFDGAEQVAMTDFWVLALGDLAQPLQYVVLPSPRLRYLLHRAPDAGQLCLYFTPGGRCFAQPPSPADLSSWQTVYPPHLSTSEMELTPYLGAWHQLELDEGSGW